jgi:hypothetical protein
MITPQGPRISNKITHSCPLSNASAKIRELKIVPGDEANVLITPKDDSVYGKEG